MDDARTVQLKIETRYSMPDCMPLGSANLDRRFPAPARVPECDDLDLARFCVDLVVEVVASAAQKQSANRLLLRVASSCPDPRLGRDEFEGSFQILDESERGSRTVGSPPG